MTRDDRDGATADAERLGERLDHRSVGPAVDCPSADGDDQSPAVTPGAAHARAENRA